MDFQAITQDLLSGRDGAVLQYGLTRGYRPLLECIAAIMERRGAPTSVERFVTTVDGSGNDCVRLSFSAPTPERIREGVTRLAATVRDEIAAALATP